MKIRDIKTFTVDCFRTNWVFVKVYTDSGVDGVGEATLEYKEKALVGAVEHIKESLVGQNSLEIEKHWHSIYRDAYWRGGAVLMSALSAVEMAPVGYIGKASECSRISIARRQSERHSKDLCKRVVRRGKNAERVRRKSENCGQTRHNCDEVEPVRKELS